jgi:formylglycine-generating enzyme required for sulfatase activity
MKHRHLLFLAGVTLMLLIVPCNLPPEVAEDCASQTQTEGAKLGWYDDSTLVYVPSGIFLMGHGGEDNPVHEVFLDDFWIYQTEVTNGMYGLCVSAGYCTPPGPDPSLPDYADPTLKDHPVVGVTWAQADIYCRWIEARLPTEAEWEKTARGPTGRKYPWGEDQPDCDRLNFNNCVGHLTNVIDYPTGASPYGAFDLSGNAFEWVSDWYKAAYYNESPSENPPGPESGEVRSVRGSSFESTIDQVRPSTRWFSDPEEFRADLGFRCVVVDAQCFAPPCETSATVGEPYQPGTPPEESTCEPPPLDVSVVTYCQKKHPYANVDPGDAVITIPEGEDCNPVNDIYVCTGDEEASFEITACSSCIPPAPDIPVESPACPPGYEYDDTTCMCYFTGTTGGLNTDCPTVFSMLFVPEQGCCQSQWTLSIDEPYCEPGYVPFGCTCIGMLPVEPASVEKCDSVTVTLPLCAHPQGVSCQAQYCRTPSAWDSNLCCCAIGGVCK